jgi:hypothetical protein
MQRQQRLNDRDLAPGNIFRQGDRLSPADDRFTLLVPGEAGYGPQENDPKATAQSSAGTSPTPTTPLTRCVAFSGATGEAIRFNWCWQSALARVAMLARANWMLDGDEATMALVGRQIQRNRGQSSRSGLPT